MVEKEVSIMTNTFLKLVNTQGIPTIPSLNITVGTDKITFSLKPHRFVGANYSGFLVVRVTQTTTGDSTLPIYLDTVGMPETSIPVKGANGVQITRAVWPGTGFRVFFYDRESNTLELIH